MEENLVHSSLDFLKVLERFTLLKKYKYPSEDYDFAIGTVISQCEIWTENVEPRKEEKLYKYVYEIELSKVAEDTVSYGEKK